MTGIHFGCLIFLESLLSLKKSRLLQLLDNEELGLSTDFLSNLDDSTSSNADRENDTVSYVCIIYLQ